MSRAIADTSIFIARESGRPLDADAIPDELAVSVITIGELRAGVLAAADVPARAQRLATLQAASTLSPVPIDGDVAVSWAALRAALHAAGRRMPANDSWIAATALHLGVPVVTQDDDYDDVPGLTAIKV